MIFKSQKNSQTGCLSQYVFALDQKNLVRKMLVTTLTTALLLITLFWTQTLHAAPITYINENPQIQQRAANFINALAKEALTSLREKGSTLADQEKRFNQILHEGFDIKYIGRLSLGRHRSRASSKNLAEYYTLFPQYLVKVYTNRLAKLGAKTVRVGNVLPNGKRDMYVRTKITNGEQKTYAVDWRVRPEKIKGANTTPNFKIIDIKIEGISMVRTQRDDFTSRISKSGMSGLLDFMQSIVNNDVKVADNKPHKAE